MRLLIVTQKVNQDDPILGFFHRWIVEFAKHCESVVVICLEEGEHELPANVKVLSLGKEKELAKHESSDSSVVSGPNANTLVRKLSVKRKAQYILRFYKYIYEERKNYDVVFVHMNPIYVVLSGFFWKALGKKVSLWYTHKSVDWKLRIAEKFADKIFTASKESFRLKSNKVIVTGHGIDTDYFVPKFRHEHSETIRLVTISRITSVKNLDLIIEAVEKLKKDHRNVSLTIVGGAITSRDFDYFYKLRSIVIRSDLESQMTFIGSVAPNEVLSYLQNADIFISMCDTGSLDKAVLEAMACGLITISPNVAFRDVLSPYGLFIEDVTVDGCLKILQYAFGIDRNLINVSFRKYIQDKHSLIHLIPKLVYNI